MAFIYDLSDTWNNAGISFNGIKLNATDTASASGSKLIDLQINGASKFTVGKTGNVIATGLIESTVGGFRFPDGTTQTTKATVNSVSGTGSVNGITLTGSVTDSGSLTLGGTLSNIANSQLTNSAITINGTSTPLGGSIAVGTVTSVAGTGTVNGLTLTGSITTSGSLTLGGTLGNIANSQLTNSAITINGTSTALGGSISVGTVTSVAALTLGTSGTDLASSVANGTTTPVITLNVPTASAANRGALSPSDWSTFNAKQAALVSGTNIKTVGGASLLGSGDVGTIGLAYGGTGATTESGARTALGLGTAAVLNAGVAGGVATLDGSGTVPTSQLPGAVLGGLNYQGTWNASTNVPTLASSTGSKGYYYVVSTAGSTNLNGITDWKIGDWAVYDGTAWQKVDNTDAVSSVNAYTGAVVLTTSDVAQGTNLYFTQAAARDSVSAGTGISYNSTTGVITNSAPDQTVALTGAGTTTVTGTYPNFTITSNDSTVGTVTSVAASGGTTGLTFTGSPITTAGTLTLGGTLAVANGGTGATTLTSGYVLKGNGTSAVSASVLYDDGTNTGIGTTSPSALFHISKNGGGDIGALVSQTNGGNGTTARYRATHGSGAAFNLQAGNGHVDLNVTSNHHLTFGTNDTERFRIGASGQFGIGGATYGSAGQVLTSGGASAAPTWTTPTTGTVTSVGGTGTVNGITLTGTVTSSGSLTLGGTLSGVNLTSQVTGTLPVANGGTGATSLTSGYLVKGNGTSAASASVVYDNGTDVGIGTASPSQKLTVANGYTDLAGLRIAGTNHDSSNNIYLASGDLSLSTASGAITFKPNTTERMRITSAGNLGLGTSSATYRLEVNLASGANLARFTGPEYSQTVFVGGTQGCYIQNWNSVSVLGTDTASPLAFATNSTERLRITATGDVGIGTASPSSKLDVRGITSGIVASGAAFSAIRTSDFYYNNILADGFDTYTAANGSAPMLFRTGGAERMRINSSGNLLVGTSGDYGGRLSLVPATNPTTATGANQLTIGEDSSNAAYKLNVGYMLVSGSYFAGSLQSIAGSAGAPLLFNADGGNVGIGLVAPTDKLHVYSGSAGTATFEGFYSFGNENYNIKLKNDGTTSGYLSQVPGAGGIVIANGMKYYGAGPWTPDNISASSFQQLDGNFIFTSNTGLTGGVNFTPVERMRLDSNGSLICYGQINSRNTALFFGDGADNSATVYATGGPVKFFANATEAMRINSSGQVGIGTSSPGAALDVSSFSDTKILLTHNNSSTRRSFIGSNAGSSGSYNALILGSNATDKGTQSNTGLASWYQEFGPYDVSGNAWKVLYQAAGGAVTERMRIDEAGNLGVGTSSAVARLTVVGSASVIGQTNVSARFSDDQYSTLLISHPNVSGNPATISGNNQLAFATGTSGNIAERVRIDAGGNVGIGTTIPGAYGGRLTVGDAADAFSNNLLLLTRYATCTLLADGVTAANGAVLDVSWASGGQGPLRFAFTGTERMRLTSGGDLGIGTSSPAFKTDVVGDIHASSSVFTGSNTDGWGRFVNSGGALYIQAGSLNSGAATAQPIIFTNMYGGSERMRIDSSGNLLVGTTSTSVYNSASATGHVLETNGTAQHSRSGFAALLLNRTSSDGSIVEFFRGGSVVGSISVTGSATAYNTSSDYRLKDIDGPIANSGAYIDALKPVQGSWKADGSRFIGLLAHEVQEVSETPIATGEKDGEEMQAMDYSAPELIANLIAEIQSLRARVAQLEGN
jgi:hypothetical protein